jgi:hypothetical protein
MRAVLGALAGLLAPALLHAQGVTQDRVRVLLDGMRGANPMQCELGLQGMNGWWNNGPEPGRDAAAWAVIQYAAHREVEAGSVAMLATALRDTDPCVRRVAARLLGRSELPAARARLLEATKDADPAMRRLGATGLGYMNDRSVTRDLVRMLDDRDPGVRAAAAWAIGAIQ